MKDTIPRGDEVQVVNKLTFNLIKARSLAGWATPRKLCEKTKTAPSTRSRTWGETGAAWPEQARPATASVFLVQFQGRSKIPVCLAAKRQPHTRHLTHEPWVQRAGSSEVRADTMIERPARTIRRDANAAPLRKRSTGAQL